MGQARIPRLAVNVETAQGISDHGDKVIARLWHLDQYDDPSQRKYWLERIRFDGDKIDLRHTLQYTGVNARTRAYGDFAEVAEILAASLKEAA